MILNKQTNLDYLKPSTITTAPHHPLHYFMVSLTEQASVFGRVTTTTIAMMMVQTSKAIYSLNQLLQLVNATIVRAIVQTLPQDQVLHRLPRLPYLQRRHQQFRQRVNQLSHQIKGHQEVTFLALHPVMVRAIVPNLLHLLPQDQVLHRLSRLPYLQRRHQRVTLHVNQHKVLPLPVSRMKVDFVYLIIIALAVNSNVVLVSYVWKEIVNQQIFLPQDLHQVMTTTTTTMTTTVAVAI